MSRYVMLPKALIDHPLYKNMSDRSKILYGILLSRKKEARSRGWVDGNGCCYVVFPKQRMQEALGCGRYSLDIATRELATVDLIKMEYERTPKIIRRIYVRGFNEHCGWVRMAYNKGGFVSAAVSAGRSMEQKTEVPAERLADQRKNDSVERVHGQRVETCTYNPAKKPDSAAAQTADPVKSLTEEIVKSVFTGRSLDQGFLLLLRMVKALSEVEALTQVSDHHLAAADQQEGDRDWMGFIISCCISELLSGTEKEEATREGGNRK